MYGEKRLYCFVKIYIFTTCHTFEKFWTLLTEPAAHMWDNNWKRFDIFSFIFPPNTHRNEGRGVSVMSTSFDCHWKSKESWVGTKNLVFCSGYIESALFQNEQKRYLMCSERDGLHTSLPL